MVNRSGLLFVSYYFPPTKTIACVRAFNVCSEFVRHFDVFVLTTSNQKKFRHDKYPDLSIQQKALLKTLDFRTFIPKTQVRNLSEGNKALNLIFKLLWNFPFNLIFGLGGALYIINGYLKGADWIRKNKITHLYSSFIPYSDHFICYLLKKKFPYLIWIADFRDLHDDPVAHEVIWPRLQAKMNSKILGEANVVTTVSYGLKEELKKYNSQVVVVRNSIGDLNTKILSSIKRRASPKFTISYTGNLAKELRKPDRLFEAIHKMKSNDIILKYAGLYHEAWRELSEKYQIQSSCEVKKLIPLEASYQMQFESNVNLLLTSSHPNLKGVLTGKFFEYLATKNPVLLIINGQKDKEFEKIFKELNCGLIVYHESSNATSQIIHFIKKLHKEWKENGVTETKYNIDKLEEYTMHYQVNKIMNQIC